MISLNPSSEAIFQQIFFPFNPINMYGTHVYQAWDEALKVQSREECKKRRIQENISGIRKESYNRKTKL